MNRPFVNGEAMPFTAQEKVTLAMARQFFWVFLDLVFLESFSGRVYQDDRGEDQAFKFGNVHREWALLMQFNPRFCLLAPRAHLKSTLLKAFAMWQMFKIRENDFVDIMYFSYKTTLADEQIEDLQKLIKLNPYCRFWRNLRPQGRTKINYLVDFGEGVLGEVSMQAEGILSGTRGRHPRVTICDDILSDYANALSRVELARITRIFKQAIMSLPANPSDPLILAGTPQALDDILHQVSEIKDWIWLRYPALQGVTQSVPLWPEKFTFDRLQRVREAVGPTAFEVEFLLTPASVTDQFFSLADIEPVMDSDLKRWPLGRKFDPGGLAVYGGVDVGKRVHPSHVAIFLELEDGTLVQIYSEFLDGMSYNGQVELLNRLAEEFHLTRGYYDATFNVLEDRNLNRAWYGKPFSRKLKANMATLLESRIKSTEGMSGIILLPDERQLQHLLTVDRELQAAQTVEGHGDAFWSNALAVLAAEDGPGIMDIGGVNFTGLQSATPGQAWLRQLGVAS